MKPLSSMTELETIVAPASPLYQRLSRESHDCVPEDTTLVQSLSIYPSADKKGVTILATLADGKQAYLALLQDNRVLKGGTAVITNDQLAEVGQIIKQLAEAAEVDQTLPRTIALPRPAFEVGEQAEPQNPGASNGKIRKPVEIDDTRFTHLEDLRHREIARFKFAPGNGALAGYICILYTDGLLLENPATENAAYSYLDAGYLQRLGIDPTKELADADMDKLEEYIRTDVVPEGMTKETFRQNPNVTRMFHNGHDWSKRIRRHVQNVLAKV